MDWYAAHLVHLYGAEIDLDYMLMRHEFGVDEFDLDVYEVAELVKDGRFDELPDGFPEKAKDVEIISGPEDMVYIGYSVMIGISRGRIFYLGIRLPLFDAPQVGCETLSALNISVGRRSV